jgi:hypothetical protein
MFKTYIDKDSITGKKIWKILQESKNQGELSNYIKLPYPYLKKKLKAKESTSKKE